MVGDSDDDYYYQDMIRYDTIWGLFILVYFYATGKDSCLCAS